MTVLLLLLAHAASSAEAGRRVALMIDNGACANAAAQSNPLRDAAGVAGALRDVGLDDPLRRLSSRPWMPGAQPGPTLA